MEFLTIYCSRGSRKTIVKASKIGNICYFVKRDNQMGSFTPLFLTINALKISKPLFSFFLPCKCVKANGTCYFKKCG